MPSFKKSIMVIWGATLFLSAALIGFVMYTTSQVGESLKQPLSSLSAETNRAVSSSRLPVVSQMPATEVVTISHYIARLDDDRIAIYAYENEEKFLYNLDIHINELTQSDMEELRRGIILHTKEELASFEEDFS